MQEIIVYIILAIVAVVLIRYIYRQVTGKNRGCNCGSCPMNGGECHCHEKTKVVIFLEINALVL